MHYLIVKYLVTAVLVVAISELARDNIRVAAVVAALPLVTTLALIWMYIEQQPPERLVSFAYYTFWYVLPTLPVFLVFSKTYLVLGFWGGLIAAFLAGFLVFLAMHMALKRLGIHLL